MKVKTGLKAGMSEKEAKQIGAQRDAFQKQNAGKLNIRYFS